jgi:hypothetical protein
MVVDLSRLAKYYLIPSLLAVTALLSACASLPLEVSPVPALTSLTPSLPAPTPTVSGTATATATASPTAFPTSEPSPTLPPDFTPPPSPTLQPTPLAILGESFWGSHQYGDYFYFFVGITDPNIVPKLIQIFDQDHEQVYGPFALMPAPEGHDCDAWAWTGAKFYQTDGIDPARLPADLYARMVGESFVYQIELEPGVGDQARIEISEPPGQCRGGTD